MSLLLHLSIHIILSIIAGLLIFFIYGKLWLSVISAIFSGTLVDVDHFIDYFLAFGRNFKIDYFANGYQFLKAGKIFIIFHGWEYVIILLIILYFAKSNRAKSILAALALGLTFHLFADCLLNEGMKPQAYSLAYRIDKKFEIKELVTPDHYQKHLIWKNTINLK